MVSAGRPRTAPNAEEQTVLGMGRILIVDDEAAMVTSLGELLQREKYEVVGVCTVAEAETRLQTEQFDLVITDIRMPEGSGMDLLRLAHQGDPDRPVIMMTAFASVESAVTAINEGAYDYLTKPVDHHELTLTVRRAIEKRRLKQASQVLMDNLSQTNLTLSRRVAELNTIHEASSALSSTADPPRLLKHVLELARRVVGAQYGSILMFDPDERVLIVEAALGQNAGQVIAMRVDLEDSIAGKVATSGKAILIRNVETDDHFARRNRPQFETNSLIAAPLKTPNRILGVICLSDREDQEAFTTDDLRLLETLGAQAAMAVQDARHYQELTLRLNEVTTLHELSKRLAEVERTDQMVMAVFAALDQLVVSDRLQWWRWDPDAELLRLEFDTAQETSSETREKLVVSLPTAEVTAEAGCASAISAVLAAHEEQSAPGALMTVTVRSAAQPLGLFAVLRKSTKAFDDSERRLTQIVCGLAERIFERQRALLNASRLATMGNMISEIAHDLRKPLTNIRGSLQVLTGNRKSPEETDQILGSTEQEILRLTALVKELVDFSNPNRYHTQKRDLRAILLRAVELIGRSAIKNGITITTDIPPLLRPIFCDENQMTEAMLNILINAVQAMETGGTLTIAAEVEPSTDQAGDEVCVTISDTGPGMSRHQCDRVFERYYTTKSTGTGLGLAIVQRIVNSCDGVISVTSTEGEGTSFILRFPVR
jgi:signal transduction histidine kinase/DNA-binding response OmpR family regulator